jgi:tight adherence protein C
MLLIILTAGLTFVLVFVLIILLLATRTPETARLISLTDGTHLPQEVEERPRRRFLTDVGWITRIAGRTRRLVGTEEPESARRLAMAGYRKSSYADVFYLSKVTIPIVAVVATILLVKGNPFFWAVVAAAVGFMLPDLWLMWAISERREAIRLSVPDALDLLVICLEAGLGLDQAIVRVGQELKISHPEISDELGLISLEQRAGKLRIEAWRNMAERTGVDSVRQFVQMLVQTERFGTPISMSLGAFSDALRVRRRQQAEEMAAKTTIKLIPPLVLFIFPSLFIVLLGPAVIMISRNLLRVMAGE